MSVPPKGRFAPSPSGFMHMGNLLSMLLAWLDERALGGQVVFRMEDLDPDRSKPEYARAIAADLTWLGLTWDEGWPDPSYCQSHRTDAYADAFNTLARQGLVYPCYCSRSRRLAALAPHAGEDRKDIGCRCAFLTASERRALEIAGHRPAWKVRVPDETVTVIDGRYGTVTQNLARDVGDFIIRRRDGVYAYQLAVAVDDMLMGVSRVVRGRDLLSSAPRQAWLTKMLGGTPPAYCHGPLLTDAAGMGKLSKRLGSLSTQVLRLTHTPEALLGELAHLAGLLPAPERIMAKDLIPLFDWTKVPINDIPLDSNGQHIQGVPGP